MNSSRLSQEELNVLMGNWAVEETTLEEILKGVDPFGFDVAGKFHNIICHDGTIVPLAKVLFISEISKKIFHLMMMQKIANMNSWYIFLKQ